MRGKVVEMNKTYDEAVDHPCVCGEKPFLYCSLISFSGSPLRMRGKAEDVERLRKGNRITPAYAGKR